MIRGNKIMANKKNLLFVWYGVEGLRDWGAGVMIAYAPNIEDARQILRKTNEYITESDLMQEPLVFDKPHGIAISGSA